MRWSLHPILAATALWVAGPALAAGIDVGAPKGAVKTAEVDHANEVYNLP